MKTENSGTIKNQSVSKVAETPSHVDLQSENENQKGLRCDLDSGEKSTDEIGFGFCGKLWPLVKEYGEVAGLTPRESLYYFTEEEHDDESDIMEKTNRRVDDFVKLCAESPRNVSTADIMMAISLGINYMAHMFCEEAKENLQLSQKCLEMLLRLSMVNIQLEKLNIRELKGIPVKKQEPNASEKKVAEQG